MTYRIESKKWILYRHTSDFALISKVAGILKYECNSGISTEEKYRLLSKLQSAGLYSERNEELPLDSINHRINTLANYMFGYKDTINGESKFLFSPLGNIFLKYIDDNEKLSKIFFTMLRGVQFPHPHGGTDHEFCVFPFRIIFKLLNDPRLEGKLYSFEYAYIIAFIKNIDDNIIEGIINQILDIRNKTNEEIESIFKANEHLYVNAVYERDYYTTKVFSSAGIINKVDGELICNLRHGVSTTRKLKRNYITFSSRLSSLYNSLNCKYPYDSIPLSLNDNQRLKIDVIKEIYSFYPIELLEEIGERTSQADEILQLPKLIAQYANNNDGEEAYLFEKVLTEGFNMFYNVEARLIGGAGKTDIECLFLSRNIKFAVDAKSTQNKLSGLNAGRLNYHRESIGGEYTIVITPRYVPSVKYDIKDTKIVIVLANTFSEYLYNNIINASAIDYTQIDNIITDNLGTDISSHISNLTFNSFAVGSLG